LPDDLMSGLTPKSALDAKLEK